MSATVVHQQKGDNDYREQTTREPNIAAVCWLTHEVRTASYARYLNATLYNIHYLSNRSVYFAPFKYIPQCLKTWIVLWKQAPDVVYVMNPPVFAALSVYLFCLVARTPFIMDTHSPSLYGRRWGWTLPLQRALAKRAAVNIVDQERFADLFAEWNAKTIVLERPPLDVEKLVSHVSTSGSDASFDQDEPPLPKAQSSKRAAEIVTDGHPFHITVVGQFASDEPVDVVVAAAHHLPNVTFSILGDKVHAPRQLLRSAPSNVIFEGYLSGSDYWDHLASVDAVMTLTTFKYSLLGGAQEGMAMGKPLILSKQPVLVDYFSKGTIFVEHNVESMVDGIKRAQKEQKMLAKEVKLLALDKRKQWETSFASLTKLIGTYVNGPKQESMVEVDSRTEQDVSLS